MLIIMDSLRASFDKTNERQLQKLPFYMVYHVGTAFGGPLGNIVIGFAGYKTI